MLYDMRCPKCGKPVLGQEETIIFDPAFAQFGKGQRTCLKCLAQLEVKTVENSEMGPMAFYQEAA